MSTALAEPSRFTVVERDTSAEVLNDASRTAAADASHGTGETRRICAWCSRPIPGKARRDAVCCSTRCRQARHRFNNSIGRARSVAVGRPLRLTWWTRRVAQASR